MLALMMQDDNLGYFLVPIVAILAIVAIIFLIRGIRRERIAFAIDRAKANGFTKVTFDKLITSLFDGKKPFVVYNLEIDGATVLVKTYGDKQYQIIAGQLLERLNKALPPTAKLCWYEDDTMRFVVLDDIDNKIATDIANLVINESNKPIRLINGTLVNIDVNLAVVSKSFCKSSADVETNLLLAMSASKQKGVNNFLFYNEAMQVDNSQEFQNYKEIKEAITNNQFLLFYQPIVDVTTSQHIAYESLLRWNHPKLGILPPSKFIDVLEQTGDIHWVGYWAFEQVVMCASAYFQNGGNKDMIFGVNLSPKQLMNDKLVDELRRITKKHRVNPNNISIEIVEFATFDTIESVRNNIDKMRQHGFLLTMDDFGLEMSSLKLIKSIEVDFIKLDRSFVNETSENPLMSGVVTALVQHADSRNIKIVAECVEDEQSLEYIVQRGIKYAQGYYFGKPLPPTDYNLK